MIYFVLASIVVGILIGCWLVVTYKRLTEVPDGVAMEITTDRYRELKKQSLRSKVDGFILHVSIKCSAGVCIYLLLVNHTWISNSVKIIFSFVVAVVVPWWLAIGVIVAVVAASQISPP